MKKNRYSEPSFESWLEEEGILEEVTEAAIKIIAKRCKQDDKRFDIHSIDVH